MPDVTVVLPTEEEAGLIGAYAMEIPPLELAIECDRQGSRSGPDLVYRIGELALAPSETVAWARGRLPHRVAALGGKTDVYALVERRCVRAAFNLSCGYYDPHRTSERIVLAEAEQALFDASTLLVD
jgi:hypothetical protein